MRIRNARALSLAAVIAGSVVVATGGAATGATARSHATSGHAAAAATATSQLAPYLKPPTSLVVTTPLLKRPPKGKKIVFLSNGIEIAQQISAGAKAAAAALGWNYQVLSVDQNNPATVASSMLTAVNSHAAAVIVSATPSAVFKSVLPVAKAKGTAIIDVASGNGPAGVTSLVNNANNNGPLWGKILALGALSNAEQSHTTANVLLVTSPVFATILGATDAAAHATVSKTCSKCTFSTLDISANDLFGGKAPADVVSYLQAHPNINYILQDSSLTDQGLVPALKGGGMNSVKIYGVAPLQAQVQEVKAGQEQGWVVDPLQVEGWMAVDAAARAINHQRPTIYNKQAIPSYLLTKQNSSGPLEVPVGYAGMFKKMWKVG